MKSYGLNITLLETILEQTTSTTRHELFSEGTFAERNGASLGTDAGVFRENSLTMSSIHHLSVVAYAWADAGVGPIAVPRTNGSQGLGFYAAIGEEEGYRPVFDNGTTETLTTGDSISCDFSSGSYSGSDDHSGSFCSWASQNSSETVSTTGQSHFDRLVGQGSKDVSYHSIGVERASSTERRFDGSFTKENGATIAYSYDFARSGATTGTGEGGSNWTKSEMQPFGIESIAWLNPWAPLFDLLPSDVSFLSTSAAASAELPPILITGADYYFWQTDSCSVEVGTYEIVDRVLNENTNYRTEASSLTGHFGSEDGSSSVTQSFEGEDAATGSSASSQVVLGASINRSWWSTGMSVVVTSGTVDFDGPIDEEWLLPEGFAPRPMALSFQGSNVNDHVRRTVKANTYADEYQFHSETRASSIDTWSTAHLVGVGYLADIVGYLTYTDAEGEIYEKSENRTEAAKETRDGDPRDPPVVELESDGRLKTHQLKETDHQLRLLRSSEISWTASNGEPPDPDIIPSHTGPNSGSSWAAVTGLDWDGTSENVDFENHYTNVKALGGAENKIEDTTESRTDETVSGGLDVTARPQYRLVQRDTSLTNTFRQNKERYADGERDGSAHQWFGFYWSASNHFLLISDWTGVVVSESSSSDGPIPLDDPQWIYDLLEALEPVVRWVRPLWENARWVWAEGTAVDRLQFTLEVLGFVPVVGAVFDAANAYIYLGRRDVAGFLWSMGSAVPGLGDAAAVGAVAARLGRKSFHAAGEAVKLAGKAGASIGETALKVARHGGAGAGQRLTDNLINAARVADGIKCKITTNCFVAGTLVVVDSEFFYPAPNDLVEVDLSRKECWRDLSIALWIAVVAEAAQRTSQRKRENAERGCGETRRLHVRKQSENEIFGLSLETGEPTEVSRAPSDGAIAARDVEARGAELKWPGQPANTSELHAMKEASAFAGFWPKDAPRRAAPLGANWRGAEGRPRRAAIGRWSSLLGAIAIALSLAGWRCASTEQPRDGDLEGAAQVASGSNDRALETRRPGTLPIESIGVGMRVPAWNPQLSHAERQAAAFEVDPTTWRVFRLSVDKGEGAGTLEVTLLRPAGWLVEQLESTARVLEERAIEELGAEERTATAGVQLGEGVGATIWLEMPELGAEGLATVESIEPCPRITDGPGQLVTATFKHSAGDVLDLTFSPSETSVSSSSLSSPACRLTLGVTSMHPFWSVDRQAFVAAGELWLGERVVGIDGQYFRLTSIVPRAGPEAVYNFEVAIDHVYYVGQGGLLVHNAYLRKVAGDASVAAKAAGELPKSSGQAVRRAKSTIEAPNSVGKLSQPLRNKMKRIGNQIAAGGNRGVSGAVSSSDAITLGERFVGPGYRVMSGNKGLISADGVRQFRFPAAKRGINPVTGQPWSNTGIQVNFQSRLEAAGAWLNNVHLDVLK